MKKTPLHPNRIFLTLAIACAALACLIPSGVVAASKAAPAAPQQTQQSGHLVIVRAANLGQVTVGVTIDGVQTAKINFGGHYEGSLPAGQHVITVIPVPNREHAVASQTRLTVQPGQTYKFTAKQSDVAIVLK